MPCMYAFYVCIRCEGQRRRWCWSTALHVFDIYTHVYDLCLVQMPDMYALYVCLICMPYMYALYVCLPCMHQVRRAKAAVVLVDCSSDAGKADCEVVVAEQVRFQCVVCCSNIL